MPGWQPGVGSAVLVGRACGSGAALWPWPCGRHGGWDKMLGDGGAASIPYVGGGECWLG